VSNFDDDVNRLTEAILKLEGDHQDCAAMRLLYELSFQEIADVKQLPYEVVRSICTEAQEQLKDLL
jgi:DNA-directed RNA polymerase specialized sigma24 family protein